MEQLLFNLPAWQCFVAIGLLLALAEIFVPGFILMPIGLGFVLTAPVAYFTNSFAIQLLALAALEVVAFLFVRKYGPASARSVIYSGAEGMVGQECEVIEEVTASKPGYVKLYGDRWQAKTHSVHAIPAGTRATITKIEGNKVFIEPMDTVGGQ